MNANIESDLIGHWIHSHEEDFNDQMVLRPHSYPLPPARGRYGYKLEKGGKMQFLDPGTTDKPQATEGTWSLEEERIVIFYPKTGIPLHYKIISIDKDRLVMIRL